MEHVPEAARRRRSVPAADLRDRPQPVRRAHRHRPHLPRDVASVNAPIVKVARDGTVDDGLRLTKLLTFAGLERIEVEEASAGDIVCVSGIDDLNIGDTIADAQAPERIAAIAVDEPTVSMFFSVNNSPFAGREGKFLTSRQIRDRLMRELESNVALRVADTAVADTFEVRGRGELHLAILIETMRREGYELARLQAAGHRHGAQRQALEPVEYVVVDVPEEYAGAVIEALGKRKAIDVEHAAPSATSNGSSTRCRRAPSSACAASC